jgi:hypothetical protein
VKQQKKRHGMPTTKSGRESTASFQPLSQRPHDNASGHIDESNFVTFGEEGGGWSVQAMFSANEKLTGRTFVYDGKPGLFGSVVHEDALNQPTTTDQPHAPQSVLSRVSIPLETLFASVGAQPDSCTVLDSEETDPDCMGPTVFTFDVDDIMKAFDSVIESRRRA